MTRNDIEALLRQMQDERWSAERTKQWGADKSKMKLAASAAMLNISEQVSRLSGSIGELASILSVFPDTKQTAMHLRLLGLDMVKLASETALKLDMPHHESFRLAIHAADKVREQVIAEATRNDG